jgi:6-phosphofructokinase 1
MINNITVLTSGGDAPSMNAAIRAVVQSGVDRDLEVFGVKNDFEDLIPENWRMLSRRDVELIMQQVLTQFL